MKILQIIPDLYLGGAERFTVDLSNLLSKENEVHLVTLFSNKDNEVLRNELNDDIDIFSTDKRLGFDFRVFKKLIDIINKLKPDIIHSHLRGINYLMAVQPFLKEIPIVHTIHSDAFEDCPNLIMRKFRRQLFKSKSVVPVTISTESQKSFRAAFKNVSSELIYNGRNYPAKSNLYPKVVEDINQLKINSETKVFTHIGRIVKAKNQLTLVNAFVRLLNEQNSNAILLLIGGVREIEESHDLYKRLKFMEKNNNNIYILGERANATDYLHASDFFCLSSKYEGMPITLIEALATGCIPISTPVGGVPEMVQDLDKSLLAKGVDVEEFYKVLKKGINIPEKQQESLKKRAEDLFNEKYSMKYCKNEYMKLYKDFV